MSPWPRGGRFQALALLAATTLAGCVSWIITKIYAAAISRATLSFSGMERVASSILSNQIR